MHEYSINTVRTHNESVKLEFMETIPSSLEPEDSASAAGALPADPPKADEAEVNIHSFTRPSAPHVT